MLSYPLMLVSHFHKNQWVFVCMSLMCSRIVYPIELKLCTVVVDTCLKVSDKYHHRTYERGRGGAQKKMKIYSQGKKIINTLYCDKKYTKI